MKMRGLRCPILARLPVSEEYKCALRLFEIVEIGVKVDLADGVASTRPRPGREAAFDVPRQAGAGRYFNIAQEQFSLGCKNLRFRVR